MGENSTEGILIVDDDVCALESIRRGLGRRLPIVTASSGEEGLVAMATRGPFAVVVSDMNMPRMDGATFLRECRNRAPDTVRLMMTGDARIETAMRAVNECGVFCYITKPCSSDQLENFLLAAAKHHCLLGADRRARVAEIANKMKDTMLATLSHELRTPLTIIRAASEILMTERDEATPELRMEFEAEICRQAAKMDSMIERLLYLSELEGGLIAFTQSSIDIATVVQEAAVKCRRLAGRRLIMPEVQPDGNAKCLCDFVAMVRAVEEILDNAAKFSGAESIIVVELESDERSVAVIVRDEGSGLIESGDAFVQCDNVLVDKPNGCGIGLAIARAIVRAHGGVLAVEKRVRQAGTAVRIAVPRVVVDKTKGYGIV